jgi:hypothetical protein
MQKVNFLIPIKFLITWISLTYVMFIFGPYEYPIQNRLFFYSYLLLVLFALYFGFKKGIRKRGRAFYLNINQNLIIKYSIYVALAFNIFLFFLNISKFQNFFSFSYGELYNSYITSSDVSFSNYVYIFISPLIFISIASGFYYWGNFNSRQKFSIIFNLLFSALSSISTGTRSGLISIMIFFIATIILKIIKGHIVFILKQKIKYLLLFLIFIISILSYSNSLVGSRQGFALTNPITLEEPNLNNVIFRLTPEKNWLLVSSICFYYSHSYYRLNKAMGYPFVGIGFGLSNSYFIMNNFEKITGSTYLKDISYAYRLDLDTGNGLFGVYWATLFTWFASDFTFPGTLVFIYLLSYLFGRVTKDILIDDNPIAVTLFVLLFSFIFSFPTNNPLQDGSGIFSYLSIIISWVVFTNDKAKIN